MIDVRPEKNFTPVAHIDFNCLNENCDNIVSFNMAEAINPDFQLVCPVCHRAFVLNDSLRRKFVKMQELIASLRDSEEILDNSSVAVDVPGGEVKVPYALLLTRLNSRISLEVDGRFIDFTLRVEPGNPDTFR